MSHPTVRLLTVLELLQSRSRITGAELSERLGIDGRTVRRYIAMLQEWGIPVLADRGRYGAYRLMPGFKLPPLMFNEDEVLALTLGLLTAQQMGLTLATPAVEGVLAKIERVLPPQLRPRMQAVQEAVLFDLAHQHEAPSPAIVSTLSTAVHQQCQVWMRYGSEHEITERRFDPYGVVYRAGRWYTAGYCHLREGLRLFRLDRVREAILQKERFTRPADFDSVGFVFRSLAQRPDIWRVRVVLKTNFDQAQQMIPSGTATLEDTPDGVELQVYADRLEWAAGFLVNLGVPFVIREPVELRETLRRLASEIAAIASQEIMN